MITFSINPAFRLFLIAAFLISQWSGSHIHLPEQHIHDGNHHLHELELHSAHIVPKLVNLEISALAADFSHQPGDTNTVYLDTSFTPSKNISRFSENPSQTLISNFRPPSLIAFAGSVLPDAIASNIPNEPVVTNYPRAPPVIT